MDRSTLLLRVSLVLAASFWLTTPVLAADCAVDNPVTTVCTSGGQGSPEDNLKVTHCLTGNIINPFDVMHNAPRVSVCVGSSLSVTVSDATGTPKTTIKSGPLETNGSTTVSGVITERSSFESVSSDGKDTDRMTIDPGTGGKQ